MESRNAVQSGRNRGRAQGEGHSQCCHHAPSRPVDPFVFKLVAFEDHLEREKGKPCLFALVRQHGFIQRWEVFLSAPWLESNPDAARRYVVRELLSWLDPDDRLKFDGVEALRPCDPFVCSLLDRVKGHEPLYELRATEIEEVRIERAIIINSCCAE